MTEFINEILWPSEATKVFLNWVFVALTLVSFVAAIVFSFVYGLLVRPSGGKHSAGRAVQAFVLSVAAIMAVIALARSFDDYPGRYLITICVYSTVTLTLMRLTGVLIYKYVKGPEHRAQAVADLRANRVEPMEDAASGR